MPLSVIDLYRMDKMKRRDAIKAIGVSVLAGGLLFHRCSNEKANRVVTQANLELVDGRELWERQRFDKLNSYTFFNEHEMETLADLSDLILPGDDQSPSATEVDVPAFIEFIVKDLPQYQAPMRNGLQWLDAHAETLHQVAFVQLAAAQKTGILDSIAYPETADAALAPGVDFFSLMRELTASGYFTTEAGMNYIGYEGNRPNVWEGVPADVLRQYGLTHLIT